MKSFEWNTEHQYWHLFASKLGTHCYLQQVLAPVIPGTNHRASDMPYIYTLVQALIEENGTWTLKATPFSNVYEALDYCDEILGYIPKFRDPHEDIYYATHAVPKDRISEEEE